MDTYGGRSGPKSAESDRGVVRLHPCNGYLRPAAMMRKDPFLSSPWRSEDIRTDGPLEPSWSRTRPAHEVRGHDLEGRRRGDRQEDSQQLTSRCGTHSRRFSPGNDPLRKPALLRLHEVRCSVTHERHCHERVPRRLVDQRKAMFHLRSNVFVETCLDLMPPVCKLGSLDAGDGAVCLRNTEEPDERFSPGSIRVSGKTLCRLGRINPIRLQLEDRRLNRVTLAQRLDRLTCADFELLLPHMRLGWSEAQQRGLVSDMVSDPRTGSVSRSSGHGCRSSSGNQDSLTSSVA